jgi:hypothetical protein
MSTLVIPIDASQVSDSDRKQQKVKVAVQSPSGIKSQIVSLEAGKTEVKIEVDPKQALSIAVVPATASDEDAFHLQTLTAAVSPSQWKDAKTLTLSPLLVTSQWWRIWLSWCREFTIDGRVVCADGSPVPGAEVHAYDVDYFWWWSSMSQVGPTTVTGPDGHFTIRFRWCCGWLPWWWWRLRHWSLDPILVDKIQPVLRINPALKFPPPSPVVTLDVPGLSRQIAQPAAVTAAPSIPTSAAGALSRALDPSTIPALREKLISVLPHVPELERLRLWPWFPWTPWFDCTPDILFRVTQNCGGGQTKVIVHENVFQTRWDIPTQLSVTLVANQDACCLPPGDPELPGDCALLTGVCGDPGIIAGDIGGNAAHPGGPIGYADPGTRDRPFAQTLTLMGQLGNDPQSDYYTIEFKEHSAGPAAWAQVPPAALLGFGRGYFDANAPFPNQWFYPSFPVVTFGTPNHVYNSRHHYESQNPPANWGDVVHGRSWFLNVNVLAYIQTFGNFPEGTYDFRVRGFKSLPNGDLDPADAGVVLPGCGGHPENNLLVLRIDNRIVGPQVPGTVHIDTTEPDCGITNVLIGGAAVPPCGAQHLLPNQALDVFFSVSDPDGHLDHYELNMLWGLGNIRNLLTPGVGVSLTNTSPAPDNQAGPDYADAVSQGAVRPTWRGGNMHLRIDNASPIFPLTCCYLIELTVWKRNIVDCQSNNLVFFNQMHYSFTVTV